MNHLSRCRSQPKRKWNNEIAEQTARTSPSSFHLVSVILVIGPVSVVCLWVTVSHCHFASTTLLTPSRRSPSPPLSFPRRAGA